MITTVDYALMAGHAYRTTRDEINWIPAPGGWTPFFPVPDPATAATFPVTTGFEAVTFTNGTEVVISYAGTGPGLNPDWVANCALALGNWSDQLGEAAAFYLQVKAANSVDGVAPNITFTGHSLGGGLAALMGVFFGATAKTFDPADHWGQSLSEYLTCHAARAFFSPPTRCTSFSAASIASRASSPRRTISATVIGWKTRLASAAVRSTPMC